MKPKQHRNGFALDQLKWSSELPVADGRSVEQFASCLLKAAAEIEHSLLVQYLYAAYSINDERELGESTLALQWKTTIRSIAREEMAHLVTVQNLLLLLGQCPYLNRPHIHRNEALLPIPFKLERLSTRSLAKYVIFESPSAEIEESDREIRDVLEQARTFVEEHGRVRIGRVGSIYSVLYWLFLESDDPGSNSPFSSDELHKLLKGYRGTHLPKELFVDSGDLSARMANAGEWGVFESTMHVDDSSPRSRALASLLWIMSQGEGPTLVEESHFTHFATIFRNFRKMGAKADKLVFDVPENPFVKDRGTREKVQGTPIRNPHLSQWADMLNVRYQLMLLGIFSALESSRTTGATKRDTHASLAVTEMEFVKRIGEALPKMPVKEGQIRGGAPFHTDPLPPTPALRARLVRSLQDRSVWLIAEIYKHLAKVSQNPIVALQRSLLEAIAEQDNKINVTLTSENA